MAYPENCQQTSTPLEGLPEIQRESNAPRGRMPNRVAKGIDLSTPIPPHIRTAELFLPLRKSHLTSICDRLRSPLSLTFALSPILMMRPLTMSFGVIVRSSGFRPCGRTAFEDFMPLCT
jgi:hypothetical protein